MSSLPPDSALPTFRALAEACASVFAVSQRHVEELGLTPAQFDVLATLGDTPGMTCKELGENTLITKGTLTGVLDRLEARGLVTRERGREDSRQIIVSVTAEGQAEYERTFDPHVAYMRRFFDRLPEDRQETLRELLLELRDLFEAGVPALDYSSNKD